AGDEEQVARDVAPLGNHKPLLVRREFRVPFGDLLALTNSAFPHARFGTFMRSGWIDDLTDDVIETAVALSNEMPAGESVFELVRMQGAIARFDASFSPIGDRDAAFYLNI